MYMKLMTYLENYDGQLVQVSFPTIVLRNRFDVLVIGILNNQGDTNSFEFSPCGTLGTLYRKPFLIKY